MNDIKFNLGAGGLGRPLAGEDHISGFNVAVNDANLPVGFDVDNRIKKVFSLEEAIDLGITSDTTVKPLREMYYALKTAYDANKKIECYVQLYSVEDFTKFSAEQIVILQRFAEGKIRQIGTLNPSTKFQNSDILELQHSCNILEAEHKPVSVVYSCDWVSTLEGVGSDLGNVQDLRSDIGSCKNVSVTIGTDGGSLGFSIYNELGFYPSIIGVTIGILSAAKVNENIGWVGRFDVSKNSTAEFDVPAFAQGSLVRNTDVNVIEMLNRQGFIFLLKHIGTAGTYFNDSPTVIIETSDYAYIENVRTIDKAVRNTRTYLLPSLNAPLYVNRDGTLTEDTILTFKNDTSRALEEMQRNAEISAFEVTINPNQNVLSTSKLAITIKIVPVGVARNIEVNIGFAVKVG